MQLDLRQLNFRLLDVFVQVVEQQGISAVARRLHLTQPTVTAQIKRLETVYGMPLVYQEGRRMLPTMAGEHLYRIARDVCAQMQTGYAELSSIRAGEVGELKIALVNTAQYILPQVVARFNQAYPGIHVELHIGNREATLKRYDTGSADVFIFSHPPTDDHSLATAFMQNKLLLIAPENHWARHQQVEFKALLEERFLVRELGSATRMVFDTWLAGQGLQLRHRTQIESNEAIRLSVSAGSGLAVLSQHIIEHGNDPVRVLDVVGFPLPGQWFLVHRKDAPNDLVIEKFKQLALQS